MSNLAAQEINRQSSGLDQAIIDIVLRGDLSRLNEGQRAVYVKSLCDRQGLDYATQPFTFMTLQGKLVIYANRTASDQLRKVNGVSVTDLTKEIVEGVLFITVKGRDKAGREDVATGAVPLDGLKGEARANAFMKCETKAKRRLTLSICGLGMLDETEVESIQIQDAAKLPSIRPEQPTAIDGFVSGDYYIPFGKFKSRSLEQVGPKELIHYIEYLETSANKQGKQITGQVKDFIDRASEFIAAFENNEADVN